MMSAPSTSPIYGDIVYQALREDLELLLNKFKPDALDSWGAFRAHFVMNQYIFTQLNTRISEWDPEDEGCKKIKSCWQEVYGNLQSDEDTLDRSLALILRMQTRLSHDAVQEIIQAPRFPEPGEI